MLFIKNCCLQLHHWSNAITISKFCSHNKKSHHCPLIYPEDSLQYLMLNVVQLLRYRTFQDQRKFWKVTMNHILSKIQYKTKMKLLKKKGIGKANFLHILETKLWSTQHLINICSRLTQRIFCCNLSSQVSFILHCHICNPFPFSTQSSKNIIYAEWKK